jgi:hypothetical protein
MAYMSFVVSKSFRDEGNSITDSKEGIEICSG